MFAAVPFAIWFFLGIEGLANVAEETINPKRTIWIGFGSAILTLVILCILTFASAIGVDGWESIVYTSKGVSSDSPLPLALAKIVGDSGVLYHLLITIGLFGLVASFHGLILAAGRASFEFGREKYAPAFLGRINNKFQTPSNALVVNMAIGILALLTGRTAQIITLSVFGALSLYIISMLSLMKLRKKEPTLPRPFVVPMYPLLPLTALLIALIALIAVIVYNITLASVYGVIMLASFGIFKAFNRRPL